MENHYRGRKEPGVKHRLADKGEGRGLTLWTFQ